MTNLEEARTTETHAFITKMVATYEKHDDVIYFIDVTAPDRGRTFDQLRFYVPKELRHTFLQLHHDDLTAGHLGVNKTLPSLRQVVYWPRLHSDVKKYVRSCRICQLAKASNEAPKGDMQPVIASVPFATLGIDFVGPLPAGNNEPKYILTIVDYFTKWAYFIPTHHCTALTAATHLWKHVIRIHGPPKYLISDNGPAFIAALFTQMNKVVGTKQHFITAYHPQANATERLNRTLKNCLRAFVADNHASWPKKLPFLETAVRNVPHASTGETPYFLLYGRDPTNSLAMLCLPDDLPHDDVDTYKVKQQQRLQQAWDLASAHLTESARTRKRNYDSHRTKVTFEPGQLVKIKTHVLSNAEKGINKKLAYNFQGPYRIIRKMSPVTYRMACITDPDDIRTVNVDAIYTYYDPETMEIFPAPSDDEEDDIGEEQQGGGDAVLNPLAEAFTPSGSCADSKSIPPQPEDDESQTMSTDSDALSLQQDDDDYEPSTTGDDPPPRTHDTRPQAVRRPPARYRTNWLREADSEEVSLPFADVPAWQWTSMH